ncbi:MAG: WD40 repeat domain-containing protein [Myxococcales bacterium]|nr:WD40 repeat domain-containing protein [Myxococcales bacterium]
MFGAALACGGGLRKEADFFTGPHTATIVDIDTTGAMLASVGEDRVVHFWSLPDLAGQRSIPLADFGTAVAFAPDGRRVAVADRTSRVAVWDTTSWTRIDRLDHPAAALAWSGDRLALAVPDANTVAIYDGEQLSFVGMLEGHTAPVVDLAFSPDGAYLATGSADRTARVWEVATGQEKQLYAGHKAGVVSVRFSPDGARLATGSQDKMARVWDVGSGEPLRQLSGHLDWVVGLAFPEEPDLLATADKDGRYRVWSTSDGGSREKVDLEEQTVEDILFLGDTLVLAGREILMQDISKPLAKQAPAPPEARVLDARCSKLLSCGKTLMRSPDPEVADRGLEVVKMAREMDLGGPAICLNTLVALPGTMEGPAPPECAP